MKSIWKRIGVFVVATLFLLLTGLVVAILSDRFSLHIWLNARHTLFIDGLMSLLTHLASGWAIVVFVIVLASINTRLSLVTAITGACSGLFVQVLKRLAFADYMRPAYYLDSMPGLNLVENIELHQYFSFPSGHATTIFALMCCVSMLYAKYWFKILCVLFAACIAYTRIYLSMHFFEDVLAGALLGTVTALLISVVVFRFIPNTWETSIIKLCSRK